jgi:ferredoxin
MAFRVVIDKQRCQSSGNCVNDDPEVFGFDADELGEVLPVAADRPLERLIAIAARCPAMAIAVFDESGAEVEVPR